MRCRTLARELQRGGADVTFLCRRQPGDLISLLEQEFVVLSLNQQPLSECEGLEGRDLYAAWLGCSQEQDAAQCLEALAEADLKAPSWLVVDHYGLDANWEEQLLAGLARISSSPKLLVIDDLADRSHQADLLMDQNFCGEVTHQRYQDLVPPRCRKLLGPLYALLGPEYAQLHPLLPPRNELRRVLVFFGGVDSDNLTGRAIEALMDEAFADLVVDVVLGAHSLHRQAVEELVARRPNTTLHGPLQSLAGLIARADLAIGACGATTWERSCLGLPSLVVAIAANQLPFAEALDKAGYLRLLGDAASVTSQQIRSALLDLIADPEVGNEALALSDGWGASRLAIATLRLEKPISLRQATAADEALLLHWANDPQVRANSFSQGEIPPADHHHWFQNGLANPDRLQLIAMSANGCPLGQIRFDLQPSNTQADASEAKLSFSLDRCARGHGLAAELVRLGLQAMEQRWGASTDAVADVLPSNTASNACFLRAGFTSESQVDWATYGSPGVMRWRFSPASSLG